MKDIGYIRDVTNLENLICSVRCMITITITSHFKAVSDFQFDNILSQVGPVIQQEVKVI